MNSVILIVLDGFGLAPDSDGNAVYIAKPKNLNQFVHLYPHTQLKASGEAVGLPEGEVGSTEVGHLNMGAGRVVYQSLPRINLSIADGTFYTLDTFIKAAEHVKKTGGDLHLIGLLGEQFVHASKEHLYALLNFCKEQSVKNVYVHVIADGRDSPPKAVKTYLSELDDKIKKAGVGRIASVMGRYYAMDRDRRWERVEKAYRALTAGEGQKAESWEEAVDQAYKKDVTDEFIEPTNIIENNAPVALIKKGDSVIFYNYRIDRPRELTKAFVLDSFDADANKTSYDPYATKYFKKHEVEQKAFSKPFDRGPKIQDLFFVTMTEYDEGLPVQVAFPPRIINIPLSRVLSDNGLLQARLAESEKERFVTFYFNGLRDKAFPGEDRFITPSPKVPTYDKKPEMSAPEMTETILKKIADNMYRFILINFANPDMVGHTGNLKAAVEAIQTVDECVGRVVEAALTSGYITIITADHGNVEEMIDKKSGKPSTEHSANPVPFIVISNELKGRSVKLQSGILADVAPTILSLLNVIKPTEMNGRNLLEELNI